MVRHAGMDSAGRRGSGRTAEHPCQAVERRSTPPRPPGVRTSSADIRHGCRCLSVPAWTSRSHEFCFAPAPHGPASPHYPMSYSESWSESSLLSLNLSSAASAMFPVIRTRIFAKSRPLLPPVYMQQSRTQILRIRLVCFNRDLQLNSWCTYVFVSNLFADEMPKSRSNHSNDNTNGLQSEHLSRFLVTSWPWRNVLSVPISSEVRWSVN